jgi:hypothetical protein
MRDKCSTFKMSSSSSSSSQSFVSFATAPYVLVTAPNVLLTAPYVPLTDYVKVRVAVISVSIVTLIYDLVFAPVWVVTSYRFSL